MSILSELVAKCGISTANVINLNLEGYATTLICILRGSHTTQLITCCMSTLLSPSKVTVTSYSARSWPTRFSVAKPWPPHASRHSYGSKN